MTEPFVPAAGRRAFTRLYDPVVALTMRERTFRAGLRAQLLDGLPADGVVVDVGCGTGTLAIALAEGGVAVIGVDPDAEVLGLARAKPGARAVRWREGSATALPLADASADRVVMSLMLHHLGPEARRAALAEARRVLRAGGRLHVADWGRPRGVLPKAGARLLARIDDAESLREHLDGRLPELVAAAGLEHVALRGRIGTVWGTLELISAERTFPARDLCG